MKIRHAASTGCIVGQFVVEAETPSERLLLEMFLGLPQQSRKNWEFHLHGHTRSSDVDGVTSFNFGYIETKA